MTDSSEKWLRAGRPEGERIVHLHVAAALRLRELDALDDACHAARHVGIDAVARRRLHVAVTGDQELRLHRAAEARLREQLLLVAVLDLLDVALDVSTDDRLVEIALRVGLADRDRRHRRRTAAHTTAATTDAVARARAGAVTDRAVTAGTDRAPARATAARTEARPAVSEPTVHLAGLVAEQTAVDVGVVEAARDVARAGQRGERAALLQRRRAEDAGVARLLDRLLAREDRVLLVLLHLVLALGAVRVLLAHLAFLEGLVRAGAAGLVGAVVGLVLLLGRRRVVLGRAVGARRRVLERGEIDVGAAVLDRNLLEDEPEPEVHGERAGEVRQHAALERGEQRGHLAARLRYRGDEERGLAGADADLRVRGDRRDGGATL